MTRTMVCSLVRQWTLAVGVLWVIGLHGLAAEIPPRRFSVLASAVTQESPPKITLTWPSEGDATSYQVFRRTLDSGWSHLANLAGSATSFDDTGVGLGTYYEYQLVKITGSYTGYGYLRAAVKGSLVDTRGKVVLLVENSVANPLAAEINRLIQDLTGDGWVVLRQNVSATDSPPAVKNIIRSAWEADKANVKAVFLLGHVPVPYSGNIYPDGHLNHRGAWPADVYYGEMDSQWTDSSVTATGAERQINWNVPGDGKFDQSQVPSEVELAVGRVDLSNMTCYANKTPARSELDITRAYLNKNHNWRHGLIQVQKRGLICDNFGDKGNDPIAGSAWRAFPGFFGSSNVQEVPWDQFFPNATANSYLWCYGSGGGSYYYSMGVGTSDDFALKDVKVIFGMFMGSYFGDWNNESNFLRAGLGSGTLLSASYSGFPHSLYFPMAMGETLGYCVRISAHNGPGGLYPPWSQGTREVHVALMGDPTLRLSPVLPPSNLTVNTSSGSAALGWNASADGGLQGYHVYRSSNGQGPFTRLSSSPVAGTTFTDNPAAGTYTYMVRAIKLEQTASGSYFNPSQGVFATATVTGVTQPQRPVAPTNLRLTIVSSTQLTLEWSDVSNESSYSVERRVPTGDWAEVHIARADNTTFSNTGLAPGTEYFFRVRAYNGAGFSPYSTEARAVTPPLLQPPVAPTGLNATASSHAEIELRWNDLPNETSFRIESKLGSGGSWAEVASLAANTTSYRRTGLNPSTQYFFRLRAGNEAGLSPYSAEVTATTKAAPVPAATAVFRGLNNQLKGAWPEQFGAEGYQIALGSSQLPTYAQVTLSGKSDFLWSGSTTDPRAPLIGPTSTQRLAATWFGDSMSIGLNVAATSPRRIALYFLDWDRGNRVQQVQMVDKATGLVLDQREVSGFIEGVYLVYDIQGSVEVRATKVAGPNAVASAIFFGGPVPVPISDHPIDLQVALAGSGQLKLRLQGQTGTKYRIEKTSDFRSWIKVSDGTLVSDTAEMPLQLEPGEKILFLRTVNQ